MTCTPSDTLLAVYRSELGERLARLELARAAGDAPAAHHEAHAMAGASGQLGFRTAAALARTMSDRLEAGDLAIEAELAQLRAWHELGCPAETT
jgi:HPt (histidine-containing phosphotransfer) domain-containing protein